MPVLTVVLAVVHASDNGTAPLAFFLAPPGPTIYRDHSSQHTTLSLLLGMYRAPGLLASQLYSDNDALKRV